MCDKSYSEEYDAYFCSVHNTWLETACSDPDCEFCSQRPENPQR